MKILPSRNNVVELRLSRCLFFGKAVQHSQHIIRKPLSARLGKTVRHAVEGFRHAARNAGQGVAVSAQGNSGANHIVVDEIIIADMKKEVVVCQATNSSYSPVVISYRRQYPSQTV